jgi:hypothetical protein
MMNAQHGSPPLGSASESTEHLGCLIRPVNADRFCRDAYLAKTVHCSVLTFCDKRPRLAHSLYLLVDREDTEESKVYRVLAGQQHILGWEQYGWVQRG